MSNEIKSFRGKNRFLSNFYEDPIEYNGYTFPTLEHAFQAAKTSKPEEIEKILNQKTTLDAKKYGKKVTLREDWEQVKLDIMKELLIIKFSKPELKEMLLATGDKHLEEGNNWGDKYWGTCKGEGLNHLGRILMEVRDYYRNIDKNLYFQKTSAAETKSEKKNELSNNLISICILDYLKKYTDKHNPKKQKDIIDYVFNEYGKVIDRKTVGRTIKALSDELGYDIVRDKGRGVYLAERPFERYELRILIDSILANDNLPEKHAKDLAIRLSKEVESKYFDYKKDSIIDSKQMKYTDNMEVTINLDAIRRAIKHKKVISFVSCHTDIQKKIKQTGYRDYMSPALLGADDEGYQLMGISSKGYICAINCNYMQDIRIEPELEYCEIADSEKILFGLKEAPKSCVAPIEALKYGINPISLDLRRKYSFFIEECCLEDLYVEFGKQNVEAAKCGPAEFQKLKSNRSTMLRVSVITEWDKFIKYYIRNLKFRRIEFIKDEVPEELLDFEREYKKNVGIRDFEQSFKDQDLQLMEKLSIEAKNQLGIPIKIGKYFFSKNGNEAPIEWQMISIRKHEIILRAKYCIELFETADGCETIDYLNSDLRKWLNVSFLNTAFSQDERALLLTDENGDFVTLPFVSCIPATQYVKQKSYEAVGKYYLGFNPCWSANHDYATDETTYSIENSEYDRIDKKMTGENVKARIAAVCPVIRVREK